MEVKSYRTSKGIAAITPLRQPMKTAHWPRVSDALPCAAMRVHALYVALSGAQRRRHAMGSANSGRRMRMCGSR